MKNLRLHLIFPPLTVMTGHPELGIPQLTANIRKKGFIVRQSDFNAEFIYRYLTEKDILLKIAENGLRLTSSPLNYPDLTPEKLLNHIAKGIFLGTGVYKSEELDEEPLKLLRRYMISSNIFCNLAAQRVCQQFKRQYFPLEGKTSRNSYFLKIFSEYCNRFPDFWINIIEILEFFYIRPKSYLYKDIMQRMRGKWDILEDFYIKRFEQIYSDFEPDIIGISIWTTNQLLPSFVLSRVIRNILPNAKILAGGAWCNAAMERVWLIPDIFDYFDAIIFQEGETPLNHLLSCIRDTNKIKNIGGVITKDTRHNKKIKIEPPPKLSTLAMPEYDGFDVNLYNEHKLVLRLSRGCYWGRCRFCSHIRDSYSNLYFTSRNELLDKRYLKSIENYIRTCEKKYNISSFSLSDNVISPAIMNQIAEFFGNFDHNVEWDALARIEREYTLEFSKKIARGGCKQLFMGLETASNKKLAFLCKGINLATVRETIKNLSQAGIEVFLFVLHYPHQPEKEFVDTLDFLCENYRYIREPIIQRFTLTSQSRAIKDPDALGIKLTQETMQNMDIFNLPFDNQGMLPLKDYVNIVNLKMHEFKNLQGKEFANYMLY